MGVCTQGAIKEIRQFCNTAGKAAVQKKSRHKIATKRRQGFTILSQDESIFTADAIVRKRMWTKKAATRPAVTVTGSHQKTIVFGALSHDGRQCFCQYDRFDQHAFIDFLKCLHKKFGRILVYADRAPQHYRSRIVREYLERNRNSIIVDWFPKGSPQFNAVEECWRQAKHDLMTSQYVPSLHHLKESIARYYRTRRFNLDILKYMQRDDW